MVVVMSRRSWGKVDGVVRYVPVLKAKAAELWAWRHVSNATRDQARFIVEALPHPSKTDEAALETYVQDICNSSPGGTVAVDTGYFDQTQIVSGGTRPIRFVGQALHGAGIEALPVFRPSDTRQVLQDVRRVAAIQGNGACLRLGSSERDPDPAVDGGPAIEALALTRLAPEDVDLVIDFSFVGSLRDVRRTVGIATDALAWAARTGNWRTVTILSGAFPNTTPGGNSAILHRWDARLFDAVQAAGPPVEIDYGDYATMHPVLMAQAGWGPNPYLKYTSGNDWHVFREQRILPGNESFFTVCQRVVASPHWPAAGPNYSAGDHEIERCSRSVAGAGRATEWLKYGLSHHLAHVADRLASQGAP